MEGRQARWHFIAWWTEVAVQCTGSGGDVEESPVGHKVGNNITMVRSLCELEWGKRRREGMELARRGGVRATVPTRKETRGGSGTGTRAKNESRQGCQGKRGVQCKGRGECGAMPRPREHDSRGPRQQQLPQDIQ
jgi:hypothetical protein